MRQVDPDPILIDLPEALVGERVLLRPYRANDAPALWEAIDESRAHRGPWMPWVSGYTGCDDARRSIARTQAHWLLRDGELTFAIHARGGRFLGACGLKPVDWSLRTFEIGYWLRASAQPRARDT